MSTDFTIHQLGHPLLRQKAELVESIEDPAFQQQLDALLAFVIDKGGMGIAAPQVGISQRFFILSSHPNDRYPYAPDVPPFAVINPEILAHSDTTSKDWEGCLSLPGIRGLVPRYNWIDMSYQTRDGNTVKTRYHDFMARVFQHELDHINGYVFIDRVESTLELMMEQEWQHQIASQRSQQT
ncbi:peptide deformylase [Methylophaga sp. OBS1]|uniref:peptide deformylase n=1 Tax=Methylophaga sp. OBS1 TaxID=2991933 RepID=UPI002256D2B9|nr:peptide deformylase [Methylophaga sp. OBS1]MCX4193431.1 peptide deformylase [Methylophaga sp. OBS1]